jgi:hypothetical protein
MTPKNLYNRGYGVVWGSIATRYLGLSKEDSYGTEIR